MYYAKISGKCKVSLKKKIKEERKYIYHLLLEKEEINEKQTCSNMQIWI